LVRIPFSWKEPLNDECVFLRVPQGKESHVLVLSRRLNEKIVLPELNIILKVVALERGRVRIGIEAPADIAVMRQELLDESQAAPSRCFRQPCTV
jgi:carbon storage regulator